MIFGQGLRKYSYKFGRASQGTLNMIRSYEKKINEFDRYYTGGVAGTLYRMTPAYSAIEPVRQTTKGLLTMGAKVGLGIGEGKPRQVLSGLAPVVDLLDQGGQQPLVKNLVYNPLVQNLYNSPFIQSKLGPY